MKNTLMVFGAIFFSGAFSLPLSAATIRSTGPAKAIVADDFSELVTAEKQIQKSRTAIDQSRAQLEKDVLNPMSRNSLRAVIVKNENIIAAYRGEALDDAQFLRAHSKDLTWEQKDAVDQAWIDLNEGPSTF
ncbi:MAG TPA: hypothetical protein VJ873_07885 [bacterium]|nr:hypothetical protein [bacterium]